MRLLFLFAAAAFVVGCPSGPGPTAPTWNDERPHVSVVQGANEPLVVDWQPEQRGDLEVTMKQGVAVVVYDKSGLKVLRDCRIDGTYGFFGITTKEQVVRLKSEQELRANLPTFGGVLAGKIGGDLKQGGTLDVALVMVGKLRTTWHHAARADLVGDCAGATHFVHGATIGAFAMDQGTSSHVRVAAEIFGVGAAGGNHSGSEVQNRDGNAAACRESDPDSQRAPKQCAALLRIELTEIAANGNQPQKEAPRVTDADRCPAPLVWVEGKCASPEGDQPHVCTYGNGADCNAQCKKGDLDSCTLLSHMVIYGKGVAADARNGIALARSTCDRGQGRACVIAAQALLESDQASAAKLAKASCDRGDEQGCAFLGTILGSGLGVPKDANAAARALVKGCNGGVESACSELGLLFERGDGVPRDDAKAAALHKRACDGDEPLGCVNFGLSLEFGSGVKKDPTTAARFYARACDEEPNYCIQMGAVTLAGSGVPASTNDALAYFQKSCGAKHPVSCAFLKVFNKEEHEFDEVTIKQYTSLYLAGCTGEVARDCTGLAVLGMAFGSPRSETEVLLDLGCKRGDAWACTIKKATARR